MSDLIEVLRAFNKERDWEQFHTPKNLACGLAVEAGELLEIFLWLSEEQSLALDDSQLTQLRDEIGDVQLYLMNLADKFGLDPIRCATEKLTANGRKYPATLVKGSAAKYSEY